MRPGGEAVVPAAYNAPSQRPSDNYANLEPRSRTSKATRVASHSWVCLDLASLGAHADQNFTSQVAGRLFENYWALSCERHCEGKASNPDPLRMLFHKKKTPLGSCLAAELSLLLRNCRPALRGRHGYQAYSAATYCNASLQLLQFVQYCFQGEIQGL